MQGMNILKSMYPPEYIYRYRAETFMLIFTAKADIIMSIYEFSHKFFCRVSLLAHLKTKDSQVEE